MGKKRREKKKEKKERDTNRIQTTRGEKQREGRKKERKKTHRVERRVRFIVQRKEEKRKEKKKTDDEERKKIDRPTITIGGNRELISSAIPFLFSLYIFYNTIFESYNTTSILTIVAILLATRVVNSKIYN